MIKLKTLLFGLLCTAGLQSVSAQVRPAAKHHRIVMQVTKADSLTQLAVIGQVRNILKELPGAEISIVCHADALDLLIDGRSKVGAHIAELSNPSIRFYRVREHHGPAKNYAISVVAKRENCAFGSGGNRFEARGGMVLRKRRPLITAVQFTPLRSALEKSTKVFERESCHRIAVQLSGPL